MVEALKEIAGEVAALVRDKDWSATALGHPSAWPGSLSTILRLMLTSRYAMWMGWGKELTFFYNDQYRRETLGNKHPWALGTPAHLVWSEIWDQVGPRIAQVLETGAATHDAGLLLFLERHGYPEETYHSFSYSPAPGDAPGEVGGLFCVVVEETETVINARRLALLRDLAAALVPVKSPEDSFRATAELLGSNTKDFPFSVSFAFDDAGEARRLGQSGFDDSNGSDALAVLTERFRWSLDEVRTSGRSTEVALSEALTWPSGAWSRPPATALVVPVADPGQGKVVGALVLGLNPHRLIDDGVRSFVDLFVGQVAASYASARAFQEQAARVEKLAELDRAKTAFFSNVSHEFRTPLTLMLGPTQDALVSPDRALRGTDLETVHRNELRLLRLVNALLDFARMEAGRTQATYEATDLAALTVDLASAFRSAVERAGLELRVECAALAEPVFVDREMWEKIVLNLLSNALKFTFKGHVGVKLAIEGDDAVLVVEDTGVGVSEQELPRMFERFHRIEGTRARTHEGSGIGLALVHDLVHLHGGTIAVTSELGTGTSFVVKMPRGSAHLPPERLASSREQTAAVPVASEAFVEEALRWMPAPTSSQPDSVKPRVSGGAPRVLVVDDNADMRDYIARVLGQHFQVETVADGQQALAAVRARAPDLVLSDVMMPVLDGFGLVRALREDPATAVLPVILLSARAGEEATAEGLRSGADDYLVKPFAAGALLVRVEAALSAARLRRALRETAERERRRLQLLFEESPASIGIFRSYDLIIELANPRLLQLWQKPASVIGKPLLEALPELRGQGFDQLLRGVLDSGVAYHGKEVLARIAHEATGELVDVYIDFVYAPLGASELEDAIVVHAFDVTDKVLARQRLEQLREEAESANRVKDEFLATMGHELRTPLNAILGWSALLQGTSNGDPSTVERGLATIERNARAQARIIDDVLDVARVISGKLRLEMAPLDLVDVARAAVDVVRPAADAKGVRLAIAAPAEGVPFFGDADRLQQVLWNLLSNSVKFTPSGGLVELRVQHAHENAWLVVEDSGVGIPAEHLPHVFERFRQVDSTSTRKYGGLGLGLAIVRHLVELHGGTAVAASAGSGRGATFTVQLPVQARAAADARSMAIDPDAASTAAPASGGALRGLRVLVVDDDDDSRELIAAVLDSAGADVVTADSARAALATLETPDERSFDVVVSDVGMPEDDGYTLLARIRALPAERGGTVPAIALTAYASPADALRAMAAGFERHIAKPMDPSTIVDAVRAVAARP